MATRFNNRKVDKILKAYVLGVNSDDDKGQMIVFANNAKEARQLENGQLDPESFIDLFVRRSPAFDDMEKLSQKELMKEQWREGWWFHQNGCPNEEESTDEEFYIWYDQAFNL